MKEQFESLFIKYLSEGKKVDSSSDSYDYVCREIPRELRKRIQRDDMIVKGSIGKGNRTDYPWIAILNKDITRSTQEGIYIVYLFKKDMSGFYLTLSQGITHFEKRYKSKKYINAVKVAEHFQDQLKDFKGFNKNSIDLIASPGTLGYGYEKTTILAKYYEKGKFNENELWEDLFVMLNIYDMIFDHMAPKSYDEIISTVLAKEKDILVEGDIAITEIDKNLEEYSNYPYNAAKRIELVNAGDPRSQRFKQFRTTVMKKIDYLKKASQDIALGLSGEKIVMEYEKRRLLELGLEEYAEKVKWVSEISDSFGYDVLSFDCDKDGNVNEMYIEVKTTSSRIDVDFFVTRKELMVSQVKSEQYAIYRIFNALSNSPKMYIAKGMVEKNFFLDPETYTATYKWRV